VFVGAVLVAVLSICVELAFGVFERVSVSAGLRGAETEAALQVQERPR
jgi:hypothetical protein